MAQPRLVAVLVVVLVSSGRVQPVTAQELPKPHATVSGEAVTFLDPVGLWDPARHRVSVAFVAKALGVDVDTASRKSGQWDVSAAGPALVVDLTFAGASTSGMVADIASCRMAFRNFKAPLSIQGGAAECHVVSTGGMLRQGGMFIGLLEGKGAAYAYRLPFTVSFVEAASQPAAVTAAAAPPAAPAIAPNTVEGSGTYAGQRLTFTHGLAWFVAKDNEVRIALFDHAPPARDPRGPAVRELGRGRTHEHAHVPAERGRAPSVPSVSYCYVDETFPKGGPMATNTNAKGCGLTELAGDARAGGRVAARLAGQTMGPGDKPFAWDLRFNLPIAK